MFETLESPSTGSLYNKDAQVKMLSEVHAHDYKLLAKDMGRTALHSFHIPTGSDEAKVQELPHSNARELSYKLISASGVKVSHAGFLGESNGSWIGGVVGAIAGAALAVGGVMLYESATHFKDSEAAMSKLLDSSLRIGIWGGMGLGSYIGNRISNGSDSRQAMNYYNLKGEGKSMASQVDFGGIAHV